MSDEILTVIEVAALLKVADKAVYTMAQQGEPAAFNVRWQWRFRRADIDAWMASQVARTTKKTDVAGAAVSTAQADPFSREVEALLLLCMEDERPFPNFVLIDSPLFVYEEPDADESSFPQDIKKHFWESVKTSFAETQVIIIENSHQLPGDGTLSDVNVVLFTGNDQGRHRFIPQAAGVA